MHSRPLTNSSWYLHKYNKLALCVLILRFFFDNRQTDFHPLCDELKAKAIDSRIYFWWKIQTLPPELSVAFLSFPHTIDFLDMFDKLLVPCIVRFSEPKGGVGVAPVMRCLFLVVRKSSKNRRAH